MISFTKTHEDLIYIGNYSLIDYESSGTTYSIADMSMGRPSDYIWESNSLDVWVIVVGRYTLVVS